MRTLLRRFFINNWQRKLVSLVIAIIIWLVVNYSLTVNKTVHDVPVRVTNIPKGKAVEGLQSNGFLNKKIPLNLLGNKRLIEQLNSSNLEIVIDAADKDSEWIATISRENLLCRNPNISLVRGLRRVSEVDLILRLSKLVKERIPIVITEPIGEAPKGYQFNDIFPYHLYISIQGPEDVVKRLKSKGLKLTFNLNEITKNDLDHLHLNPETAKVDEVSYLVPDRWKKVILPSLTNKPLLINDPKASTLRIDFLKTDLIPLNKSIPINVYYPEKHSVKINPNTYKLKPNNFVKEVNGVMVINAPLYVKGVSKMFLDVVKDRIQIVSVASPRSERKYLPWNVQFIYPHELENRYIAKVLAQKSNEVSSLAPKLREEYLRNRFRNYMSKFRLFTANNEKLTLRIELNSRSIDIQPVNLSLMANHENASNNSKKLAKS